MLFGEEMTLKQLTCLVENFFRGRIEKTKGETITVKTQFEMEFPTIDASNSEETMLEISQGGVVRLGDNKAYKVPGIGTVTF